MSEFLAEARILVRPDTTKFRAELIAEVETAVAAASKLAVVPIQAQVTTSGAGSRAAAQEVAGALQTQIRATAAASSATAELARVQRLAATSAADMARSELLLTTSSGRLASAQIEAGLAIRNLARQEEILAIALRSGNAEMIRAASFTTLLTRARQQETAAALAAARAEGVHAGTLGAVRTAGIASGAALLGLRGAVLTAGAAFLGATAAFQAFSKAVQSAAEFERELSVFRVTAEATAAGMQRVREEAVALGRDISLPAVSSSDAAEAMTNLARAGLSVEDSLAGARGVLQLAAAAQLDTAEAAQIAANALNAFGLAGSEATAVADAFANAAVAAQGSIADIGIAFRQAATVSRQVGLSLNDTTAILALFAKNGLQASDAGTALRTALIRLVAPGDAAAKKIDELGLKIRDAQGNLRADVFAQFGDATRNLAPAARDAAAALIFGQDAIRAVAIGAREGTDGLRLMQFEIDQTGTAAELAAARTQGFAGQISALQSNVETLGTQIGQAVNPVLGAYLGLLNEIASATSLAVEGLARAAAEAKRFGNEVEDSVPGIGFLGDVLKEVAATSAAGGIIPLQAIRGFKALTDDSTEASKRIKELNEELQALQTARTQAQRGGQREVADTLTAGIKSLRQEIDALKREGAGIPDSLTEFLKEAVAELEKAKDLRISVDVDADTTDLDKLIASLNESIPISQKTEGNISRLRDEIVGLGADSKGGAEGVDALTKALNALQGQSAAASDELLRLQNANAGPQAQLSVLRQQEAVQFEIIANLKADGIQAGEPTQIRAARQEIERIQGQIEALQNEIVSSAKETARKGEQAAKDVVAARDKADRALIDALTGRREDVSFAAAEAGLTAGLQDDIRAQDAIQALIRRQIIKIREQVKGEEARQDALRALQTALRNSQLAERRLRQQQAEAAREAQQARFDQRQRALELNLEFAEITDNESAQRRALNAIISALEKRIAAMKGISNKERELRNELARRRKQLEELTVEQEKNNRAAEFFFESLQTQAGFAANLIGNLIPGGATGGLVGVPDPTSRVTLPPSLTQRERSQAGDAVGVAPVTAGQGNTQIDILRRILFELVRQNRGDEHPEATRQRRTGAAAGDYGGGTTMGM